MGLSALAALAALAVLSAAGVRTFVAGRAADPAPSGPSPTTAIGRDIGLPAEVRTLAARVTRGATLASLLHAHAVAEHEVAALVARAASVFDVRALRTDRPYRIVQAIGGALRRFEYEIDGDRVLTVARGEADDFVATINAIPKRAEAAIVSGTIDRESPSLVAAMARAGERIDLTMALAEVLSSEVDFNTELQPGDRFRIVVAKQFRADEAWVGASEERDAAGGFAGYGAIDAAEFLNAGRHIRAVRFTPAGGTPQYFDEQGRSLRRFFLKSPLKFDPVVTSRFSNSRLHPVLGFHRAHLGVDYRAPVGAPVVAVADGQVVSAGFNGGAGRMVHLRHANGLETQYLHLSAIAVRAGTRIRQGDLVGRVGASGLATGPHLDYRVRKDGTFVNPVAVHQAMPPGDPVSADDRPAFEAARLRAFGQLDAAN